MSREVKVFRSSYDPDTEPYPFVLEFTDLRTKEKVPVEFTALGDPGAGGEITRHAILKWDPQTGQRVTDLTGLTAWFKRVLMDDGYERLTALLEDPNIAIDLSDLTAAFRWLVGEYGGRPTMRSAPSSNGAQTDGPSSTAAASVAGST